MPTGSPDLRRATATDVAPLARALARAFLDDPVSAWSCPREAMRPGVLERLFGIRLRQLLVHREVWTTDELASVAIWARPDHWKTTTREDIALASCMLHPRLIPRLPLVIRGLLGIEAKHPREPPHWYLAVLGTDPSAQGRGLGSAVMQPVLAECDRDGVAAYLESSREENNSFYARHGFRVTLELRLPRGPVVWPMWREPAG